MCFWERYLGDEKHERTKLKRISIRSYTQKYWIARFDDGLDQCYLAKHFGIFWTYFGNYNALRQIFHCCKWPNIEQIIYPSGHTGLDIECCVLNWACHVDLVPPKSKRNNALFVCLKVAKHSRCLNNVQMMKQIVIMYPRLTVKSWLRFQVFQLSLKKQDRTSMSLLTQKIFSA